MARSSVGANRPVSTRPETLDHDVLVEIGRRTSGHVERHPPQVRTRDGVADQSGAGEPGHGSAGAAHGIESGDRGAARVRRGCARRAAACRSGARRDPEVPFDVRVRLGDLLTRSRAAPASRGAGRSAERTAPQPAPDSPVAAKAKRKTRIVAGPGDRNQETRRRNRLEPR